MLLHVDADAFFASVEQAADARLRGRPMAVGGERRGIIASASYEARRMGVYTPMPTAQARRVCPQLIVVPGDFEKYERFSRLMFAYAYDFTPVVEITGLDEGYMDLSGNARQSAPDVARIFQRAVFQSLKISISQGVAANKLVSQIASKLHKPAGLITVPAGREAGFLQPLESKWLPGVGPSMAATLRTAGLGTIGAVAAAPLEALALLAGKSARQLRAFARGLDDRPVIIDPPAAKSYGEQDTFDQDVTDEPWVLARLRVMADRLMVRVRSEGRTVRTVTLRLRYNDMAESLRSASLPEPTDLEQDFYPVLHRLMKQAWDRRVSLRMVGLRYSNVYDGCFSPELPLEGFGAVRATRLRLAGVMDELRSASFSVMRGHDLWLHRRRGLPRPAM